MRITTLLWAIVLVPLFACGGDSSSPAQPGATEGSTPPVSAANPDIVGSALERVTDPSVAQCLDLITQSQFSQAVPVCMRAAAADPENAEVKTALETARSKAAAAPAEAATQALEKAAPDVSAGMEAQKAALETQKAALEAQKAEMEAAKEGLKGQLPPH